MAAGLGALLAFGCSNSPGGQAGVPTVTSADPIPIEISGMSLQMPKTLAIGIEELASMNFSADPIALPPPATVPIPELKPAPVELPTAATPETPLGTAATAKGRDTKDGDINFDYPATLIQAHTVLSHQILSIFDGVAIPASESQTSFQGVTAAGQPLLIAFADFALAPIGSKRLDCSAACSGNSKHYPICMQVWVGGHRFLQAKFFNLDRPAGCLRATATSTIGRHAPFDETVFTAGESYSGAWVFDYGSSGAPRFEAFFTSHPDDAPLVISSAHVDSRETTQADGSVLAGFNSVLQGYQGDGPFALDFIAQYARSSDCLRTTLNSAGATGSSSYSDVFASIADQSVVPTCSPTPPEPPPLVPPATPTDIAFTGMLSAPQGLSATASATGVTLQWQATPDATGYRLCRGPTSSVQPENAELCVTLGSVTAHLDDTGLPGTEYCYVLQATDAATQGPATTAVCVTTLSAGSASAGPSIWNATVNSPGAGSFQALDLTTDGNGNLYLLAGRTGLWSVTGFDASGTQLFQCVNDSFAGTPRALAVDANQRWYLTGSVTQGAQEDLWVAQYNSSCVQQWQAFVAGQGKASDEGRAVRVDATRVYVAGTVKDILGDTRTPALMTIAYTQQGVEVWRDSAPTNSIARGIAVDPVNRLVTVAGSQGTSYLIRQYTSDGVMRWSLTNPTPANEMASAVVADANGNVVATWGTEAGELRIGKYDTAGAALWSPLTVRSGLTELPYGSLGLDANGEIYLFADLRVAGGSSPSGPSVSRGAKSAPNTITVVTTPTGTAQQLAAKLAGTGSSATPIWSRDFTDITLGSTGNRVVLPADGVLFIATTNGAANQISVVGVHTSDGTGE